MEGHVFGTTFPRNTPVFVARGDGSETFAFVAGDKNGTTKQ